jgi:hypothetical protein
MQRRASEEAIFKDLGLQGLGITGCHS